MNKKFIILALINSLILAGVAVYLALPQSPSVQDSVHVPLYSQCSSPDYEVRGAFRMNLPDAQFLEFSPEGYYVASPRMIHLYDAEGQLLKEIPNDAPENITAIAYAGGKLYVAKQGVMEGKQLSEKSYITDILVQGEQMILADAGQRKVLICQLDGTIIKEIAEYEAQRFKVPSPYFSLSATDEGGFWVADPAKLHLVHFDDQGDYVATWAPQEKDAFMGCCNPARMRCLPNGEFICFEKGNMRLRQFSPSGAVKSIIASADDFAPASKFQYDFRVINENEIAILDGKGQYIKRHHKIDESAK